LSTGIIDAHQHLAAPSPEDAAAPGKLLPQASDLAPLLEENGVERTVLVQAETSAARTDLALAAAAGTDYVGAASVWVDLNAVDGDETLDRIAVAPKVRGVFLPVWRESDNRWLLTDHVVRGLRAAAERGLAAEVQLEPRHLPSIVRLAEQIPELRIVIAHIGSPFIARSEREPWGVYMLNIAPCRNVFAKLSGLVTLDTRPRWDTAHIRLFVESAVRLFGYERLMFGSDWPVHLPDASYAEVLETTLEAAGPMTDRQRMQLLRGTASAFYRID
jgi:L-fuconolactonase